MTVSRREFLKGVAATAVAGALPLGRSTFARPEHRGVIRFGYAAITWGGADLQAIDEISGLGYPGIQLRNGAVAKFGGNPTELRDRLAARKLTLVALSSGNVTVDPSREADTIAEHVGHARFLRDVGGLYLQVIDERPAGRAVTPDDCARLGGLLSEIGRRTAEIGVPLVYHQHMHTISEQPDDAERVLAASDPRYVKLLLDVAHWQQGGGDPVAAIRRYRDRIGLLHLKDVTPLPAADGKPAGYRFVELGRGRVDLPAVFDALRDVRYEGWAIVELDSVADLGHSAAEGASINKRYLESRGFSL
jgi:inosose dehydratase